MLKDMAIFVVLLTVAQTSVPTLGQAANSSAVARANVQNQGDNHETPSKPALSSAEVGDALPVNDQHPVSIAKFPPVSINRDWADWGLWVFNALLVAVGILQVALLWGTLAKIKRQADLMEKQDRTARDKQRARLSIIFPLEPPSARGMIVEDPEGRQSQMLDVGISIVNDGETSAFNVKASGYFLTESIQTGKIYASRGDDLAIDKVIRKADLANPIRITLAPAENRIPWILREDWKAVTDGTVPLQVIGLISYDDVFGECHETPFHYIWQTPERGSTWEDEEGLWADLSSQST